VPGLDRTGPWSSSGTNEPKAELSPMTSEFAMEIPNRSTLTPNRMAPKPQAKPKPTAAASAGDGEAFQISPGCAIVAETTAAGIAMQAVTMNTSQMFPTSSAG
jgi:hypothetical protein